MNLQTIKRLIISTYSLCVDSVFQKVSAFFKTNKFLWEDWQRRMKDEELVISLSYYGRLSKIIMHFQILFIFELLFLKSQV